MTPPRVLFVCARNGGKSQMAAALLEARVDGAIDVASAGTRPGDTLNALSVTSLQEIGIDITGRRPRRLTPEDLAAADLVVVLGREAAVEGAGTPVELWDTDEPSARGIEGPERMRLVRDDIAARVDALAQRLGT